MEPVVGTPDPELDDLRRVRAELRGSMTALEQALAAPASGRGGAWAEGVDAALAELSADFREHVTVTEGPSGLHGALVVTAPRLSHSVHRLVDEHAVITELVGDLLSRVRPPMPDGEVDTIRDLATALLDQLERHRRRGADLIYEAYHVDLGGET
jgi:hypothetical protein